MVPPVACKSDNLTKEGDLKDVKRGEERSTKEAVRLQLMWSRLIIYIVCIFCVTAFVLANAAWAFYIYFPRNCDDDVESAYQSTRVFPRSQLGNHSFNEEVSTEEAPTTKGVAGNASVSFVERRAWGAQEPAEPLTKLKLPVPYVIVSHTATEYCYRQVECTLFVRFSQTFHVESRGWSDIAYNFLVGGDGSVFVGRGWDFVGAHSFGFNNRSIGISFIGMFNTVIPTKVQLDAAQRLMELGVEIGKIDPDYKLLGQRQVSRSQSPGDALYDIVKKWPHWSPEP